MPPSIQRAKPGDRATATWMNKIIDAVEGDESDFHGGQGSLTHSIGGTSNTPDDGWQLSLWELTTTAERDRDTWKVKAWPTRWNRDAKRWEANTDRGPDSQKWIYFTAGYQLFRTTGPFEREPRTSREANDASGDAVRGEQVIAAFSPDSGRYEHIGPPSEIVRFELKTALVQGGEAEAFVSFAEPGNDVTRSDQTVLVKDWQNRFAATIGAKGYARRMADLGRFEVLSCTTGTTEAQELWLCDTLGQEFIPGSNIWKPTAEGQIEQLRWTGASRTANTTAFKAHRAQLIPNRFIGVKILENGDYEIGYKANPVMLSTVGTATDAVGSWEYSFRSYLFVDRAGAPFDIPCSLHYVEAVGENVPLDQTSFIMTAGDADSLCVVSLMAGDIVSVVVDCEQPSNRPEAGWMFLAETSWMHIRKLTPLLFESALVPDPTTTTTNGTLPNNGSIIGVTAQPTIQPRTLINQDGRFIAN